MKYLPRSRRSPVRFAPLAGTLLLGIACSLSSLAVAQSSGSDAHEPSVRWWKGNLHTHTLWSDGDDFPEMVADWYVQHGYHFLALSDHNVLSQGVRWIPMKTILARGGKTALEDYRKRFGDAWVETRGEEGTDSFEVRLKPLNEFRALLEEHDRFIMIQGEEISDRAEGKPVHINASNLKETIEPVGGATVREAMQNNLRAILEQEKAIGRPILPHVNHPNFGYAMTAADLAAVVSERFFEVYNGHPGVNHLGDEDHPSVEAIWDLANAIRLSTLAAPPLLGIATDDSHEYHGLPGSHSGRGWVMVQSQYLTPEHLIRAMRAARFYASSGVRLDEVGYDEPSRTLSLKIQQDGDATYRTEFIATLRPEGDAEATHAVPAKEQIGVVIARSDSLTPSYQLTGNELYVRAVVTSSQPHPDPSFENQHQQAWTQPVGWQLEPTKSE